MNGHGWRAHTCTNPLLPLSLFFLVVFIYLFLDFSCLWDHGALGYGGDFPCLFRDISSELNIGKELVAWLRDGAT